MMRLLTVVGWVLGTLFGLSCFITFFNPYLLQVPITLVLGWAPFLWKVLPQVTLNGGALVETVLVVAALGGGLHFFLRWLWRSMQAPETQARDWPVRWSVSLLALLVLLFLATMATVGIGHHVGWLASSRASLTEAEGPFRMSMETWLCRTALELSHANVPDAEVGRRLLVDEDLKDVAEGMHVVPVRSAGAPVRFLVFPRDPLMQEGRVLRCEGEAGDYREELYRAQALPQLLAGGEAQADGKLY